MVNSEAQSPLIPTGIGRSRPKDPPNRTRLAVPLAPPDPNQETGVLLDEPEDLGAHMIASDQLSGFRSTGGRGVVGPEAPPDWWRHVAGDRLRGATALRRSPL